ncbi:hypothetical protein Cgig2_026796 [Carnegiea gigantea]|uniref:Uncharacterized protein n=1 Tax=Carnegiea gigantea TaxID=171969 RepID=A0A9Q1JH08_9CARY|nr:hypothetical protein Cgig2_026796 [Carnegiea gigantea]
MEAKNSVRPLPTFDYVPFAGCEPSHMHAPARCSVGVMKDGRSWDINHDRSMGLTPPRLVAGPQANLQILPLSPRHMQLIPDAPPSLRNRSRPELKKALHELTDKGLIDCFLKRGSRFLHKEHEPVCSKLREEECIMEIVATIVGGHTAGITRSAWKAQLRGAQ